MEYNREIIEEILRGLENLSSNYHYFEIALLIFLRSDLFTFKNYITNGDLSEIEELIKYNDSLLDINKEDIDSIIEGDN